MLNDFLYQVEDLLNSELSDLYLGGLCLYSDRSLNAAAVRTHVINSEAGMPVSRLMRFIEDEGKLKGEVRCLRSPDSEDNMEALSAIYEDEPHMLLVSSSVRAHLAT